MFGTAAPAGSNFDNDKGTGRSKVEKDLESEIEMFERELQMLKDLKEQQRKMRSTLSKFFAGCLSI